MLSQLEIINTKSQKAISIKDFTVTQTSYNSHLEQVLENETLKIKQTLFFSSSHSAIITSQISNKSEKSISLKANWSGTIFSTGLQITKKGNTISLINNRSTAKGTIQTFDNETSNISSTDSTYSISLKAIDIAAGENKIIDSCSNLYICRI